MMNYKGYVGVAEIAFDTGMIYGRVAGLRDVVTFQGHTVAEAERAFHDSVDDYLELCASRNEAPEKPFSGKFLVRIPPALHRALADAALARGVSLNALVEAALSDAFLGPETAREPKAERPRAKAAKSRAVAADAPAGARKPASPR
jgi:predicted HicB family RNase H-like nuclease